MPREDLQPTKVPENMLAKTDTTASPQVDPQSDPKGDTEMARSQPHQVHPPTQGVTMLKFENHYDEDGCPGCELVRLREAASEARERWAHMFQESQDVNDRTVREALATALHYIETACDHAHPR